MKRLNIKKSIQNSLQVCLTALLLLHTSFSCLYAEEINFDLFQEEGKTNEKPQDSHEDEHSINFQDVPIMEFIRFVSKISGVNFIFNNQDFQFNVTIASGKSVNSANVLKALIHILRVHGFRVMQQEDYFVIHKMGDTSESAGGVSEKASSTLDFWFPKSAADHAEFFVHKLKYHQGSEIQDAIKRIAADLQSNSDTSPRLLKAIHSMQWIKATNSILCSADSETVSSLKKLIESLDVPLRQVFIEILVIETDVKKSLDFGLQWAAGGQYESKVGFGIGNFPPLNPTFANTVKGINATNTPTGMGQIPIGSGFDIGVIGDLIMHKGKSYLALGALVSALQKDGESTIVLNQKLITQDNKNSKIFVGDNIPFTGSVVQTIGPSQQTTANIEYRDVGVNLSITPMLGDGDVITLDIDQEITDAFHDLHNVISTNTVNGIVTTKTNMMTHAHVPDRHFLVLSGMVRNIKTRHKTGIPCLGGLPVIGAAFSDNRKRDEKRNVIIFVRPQIIHSFEEYNTITQDQEDLYRSQANSEDFDAGINLVQ